jgi:hypothetical protein
MKEIRISWELTPEAPARPAYHVNDSPVGEGDEGFDRILDLVRSHKDARVILHVKQMTSLGGGDLEESLPFGDRLDELGKELGERKIVYEFF